MKIAEQFEEIRVFYCYSRKDEDMREKLDIHLKPLKRSGLIKAWHDREIEPGTNWKLEISMQLNIADIVLLLISPDFMASNYCYSLEMQKALELHNLGKTTILPIILRPALWQETEIGSIQALPKDGKPISTFPDLDQAFIDVATGIKKVAERLSRQKAASFQKAEHIVSNTNLSKSVNMFIPDAIIYNKSKLSNRSLLITVTCLVVLLIMSIIISIYSHFYDTNRITSLTNTNATLVANSGNFVSNALGKNPSLEAKVHRFTITVDVNGILNNSSQTIASIKSEIIGQPFLRGSSVGLAIVYGSSTTTSDINTALNIAQKMYAILQMLGREGPVFSRAQYYKPLYTLGESDDIVTIDLYLFSSNS
jgi:TIR domain